MQIFANWLTQPIFKHDIATSTLFIDNLWIVCNILPWTCQVFDLWPKQVSYLHPFIGSALYNLIFTKHLRPMPKTHYRRPTRRLNRHFNSTAPLRSANSWSCGTHSQSFLLNQATTSWSRNILSQSHPNPYTRLLSRWNTQQRRRTYQTRHSRRKQSLLLRRILSTFRRRHPSRRIKRRSSATIRRTWKPSPQYRRIPWSYITVTESAKTTTNTPILPVNIPNISHRANHKVPIASSHNDNNRLFCSILRPYPNQKRKHIKNRSQPPRPPQNHSNPFRPTTNPALPMPPQLSAITADASVTTHETVLLQDLQLIAPPNQRPPNNEKCPSLQSPTCLFHPWLWTKPPSSINIPSPSFQSFITWPPWWSPFQNPMAQPKPTSDVYQSTTDDGLKSILGLTDVYFVEGLSHRLLSLTALSCAQNFSVLIKNRATTIQFPNGSTYTWPILTRELPSQHHAFSTISNPNPPFGPDSDPDEQHFDDTTKPIDTDQQPSVTALPLELIYRQLAYRNFSKPHGWIPSPNMEWSCPNTNHWPQFLAAPHFNQSKTCPKTKTPQRQGTDPFHRLYLDLFAQPISLWSHHQYQLLSLPVHCHNSWQTYRLDWSPNWKHSFNSYRFQTVGWLLIRNFLAALNLSVFIRTDAWKPLLPQQNSFLNAHHLESKSKLQPLNIKKWTVSARLNGVKSTTRPTSFSTVQDLEVPSSIMHMLMQFKFSMSALPKMWLTKMATQQPPIYSVSNKSPASPTSVSLDVLHSSNPMNQLSATRLSPTNNNSNVASRGIFLGFSWQLCRLANLLSWSTAKPHCHPRCLVWWRL